MATKSGYYIDDENDTWARREAARRGTSKSEVGRDALAQYRRSIDAIPPVSKVRPIPFPGTPKSSPDTPKNIGEPTAPNENETDFWRTAALFSMFEARKDRTDSHGPGVSAADLSLVVSQSTIPGPADPRRAFRAGCIVRVRRRDGSTYLARVC